MINYIRRSVERTVFVFYLYVHSDIEDFETYFDEHKDDIFRIIDGSDVYYERHVAFDIPEYVYFDRVVPENDIMRENSKVIYRKNINKRQLKIDDKLFEM